MKLVIALLILTGLSAPVLNLEDVQVTAVTDRGFSVTTPSRIAVPGEEIHVHFIHTLAAEGNLQPGVCYRSIVVNISKDQESLTYVIQPCPF